MREKRGFTLIELMIVVAIVIIVAVVAVPGVLQTAKSDNQQKAISALKAYYDAQYQFKDRGLKKRADNPSISLFARPFSELSRYGEQNLGLVSPEFAAAVDAHHGFNGYYFADDPRVPPGSESVFGLFAVPCLYGKTGDFVYFIDGAGKIHEKDPGAQINTPSTHFTGANHPRDPAATGWVTVQ